ncbi:MAG: hypothetical protein ACLRSE_13135 [Alistipes finegoldii]
MPLALSSPSGARGLPALSGSSAPPLFMLNSARGLGVCVVSSLPETCAVCSTGAVRSCTRGSVAVLTRGLGGSERRRLGEVDRDRIARLVVDLPEVERDQRERTDQQQRVDRRRNRRPPAGIPVI